MESEEKYVWDSPEEGLVWVTKYEYDRLMQAKSMLNRMMYDMLKRTNKGTVMIFSTPVDDGDSADQMRDFWLKNKNI
jgi:hypothetical protein